MYEICERNFYFRFKLFYEILNAGRIYASVAFRRDIQKEDLFFAFLSLSFSLFPCFLTLLYSKQVYCAGQADAKEWSFSIVNTVHSHATIPPQSF